MVRSSSVRDPDAAKADANGDRVAWAMNWAEVWTNRSNARATSAGSPACYWDCRVLRVPLPMGGGIRKVQIAGDIVAVHVALLEPAGGADGPEEVLFAGEDQNATD